MVDLVVCKNDDSTYIMFMISILKQYHFIISLPKYVSNKNEINAFIGAINLNESSTIYFGCIKIDFNASDNEFNISNDYTNDNAGNILIKATKSNREIVKQMMKVMVDTNLNALNSMNISTDNA